MTRITFLNEFGGYNPSVPGGCWVAHRKSMKAMTQSLLWLLNSSQRLHLWDLMPPILSINYIHCTHTLLYTTWIHNLILSFSVASRLHQSQYLCSPVSTEKLQETEPLIASFSAYRCVRSSIASIRKQAPAGGPRVPHVSQSCPFQPDEHVYNGECLRPLESSSLSSCAF